MPGRVQSWFKVRFFTGVFVTLPVVLTAWLFWLFYSSVDDFMAPLYEHLLGRHLPGLGFVTAILIIFCVGVFATNVVGRRILQWGERIIRTSRSSVASTRPSRTSWTRSRRTDGRASGSS